MAFLAPIYNDAQNINSVAANGAKLFTYVAGSSTKITTFTDQAGLVPQANPIILNSRGEPPSPIWLTGGTIVDFVFAPSTDSDPPVSAIRTVPNIKGVGDTLGAVDQWVASGIVPTFVSANSFTLPGDQTAAFQVGRRLKLTETSGTVYGTISASVFGILTTITMTMDLGQVLDSGLSIAAYGIISPNNNSLPFNLSVPAIQNQTFTAFTTGGTSAAFTLTPIPAITANVTLQLFFVKFNAAPTGSPTLAVSGQTALNLKYYDVTGNKLFVTAGQVPINWQSPVFNDGTDWVVQNTVALSSSSFKNKVIGGDFGINPWQYGTNFPAVANGTYTADRFLYAKTGSMVHTVSKSADVPSAVQAGLYSGASYSLAVTTAQVSPAAGDFCFLEHRVEGINAVSFGFGQAGVRNVTLSFWAKMAKTGVHCVAFRNAAANRCYVAEYTVIAANTWEFKNIIIPVDTSGTWNYDNNIGVSIAFMLAAGTGYQTTANSWQASGFLATANQVNEVDTIGNTCKIDWIQLEPGSATSPFDVRDVGRELFLCERYYIKLGGDLANDILMQGYQSAGSSASLTITLPTQMRVVPTIAKVGTWGISNSTQPQVTTASRSTFVINATITALGPYQINTVDTSTYLTASAEL